MFINYKNTYLVIKFNSFITQKEISKFTNIIKKNYYKYIQKEKLSKIKIKKNKNIIIKYIVILVFHLIWKSRFILLKFRN